VGRGAVVEHYTAKVKNDEGQPIPERCMQLSTIVYSNNYRKHQYGKKDLVNHDTVKIMLWDKVYGIPEKNNPEIPEEQIYWTTKKQLLPGLPIRAQGETQGIKRTAYYLVWNYGGRISSGNFLHIYFSGIRSIT
jgi:hypothetical protein